MIQLAKVMAVDHARDSIRVNTLSPGAVENEPVFPIRQHGRRSRSGRPEASNRSARPAQEVGRAALYLASDASSFMTGSDLLIDGGYTAV